MRGKIGFARITQRIGETVPPDRLQSLAPRGRLEAIVDSEKRAALPGDPARERCHHLCRRKTRLQHLPWLTCQRQSGFRAGREAKTQMPFAIEADKSFVPAILGADKMANRQAIEKFIGNDDCGTLRQLAGVFMPLWNKPAWLQRAALLLSQGLARLDEMEIEGFKKPRLNMRRAQSVSHEGAAPWPQFGEKKRTWRAHRLPDSDAPKAGQLPEHLADLRRRDEITFCTERHFRGIIAMLRMPQREAHIHLDAHGAGLENHFANQSFELGHAAL